MSYRSRNLRIPQYVLLDIDDNSQSICKQIFQNIIPYIQNNATDKDLVQSLFGNKFNPTYLTHSDSNETIPIIQGKLCSNISNEWILFTILEQETLEKSIDKNAYIMEFISNGSEKTHECESFDFKECSVNNLQNDYPRLFQFDHEQHIKRFSTRKKSMPIEIGYVVYNYIRRKAVDYIEYQDKLTRINSALFNITIVPAFISSRSIGIKVKIIQNNVFFPNMDCVATLQRKNFNQTHSFQIINSTIHFDQLIPSTNYNICASCQGINKICKQIETSKIGSSTDIQTIQDLPSRTFIYIALTILIFFILFGIFFTLLGSTLVSFWCRQSTRSNRNRDNQPIISNPIYDSDTDTVERRRSVHSSLDTLDGIQVAAMNSRHVQEVRGSISSTSSIDINRRIYV